MRIALLQIAAASLVWAGVPSNSVTADSTAPQINRPTTISRVFAKGEFGTSVQPRIAGAAPSTWQTNVLSRWENGSVKHALISFVHSFPSGNTQISFAASSDYCHLGAKALCDAAALTQNQMLAFNETAPGNEDGWGFQIEATAGGVIKNATARNMLRAGAWRYWVRGPVVDIVIVEDKTTTLAYDFGWYWNGTTMQDCETGSPACTLNPASYRSIHPIFVLTFYHGYTGVKAEYILENVWVGKRQDQYIALAMKKGGSLATTAFSTPDVPYLTVSSMSTSGTPTIITAAGHGLTTGQVISLNSNGAQTARGNWPVTVIDANTFSIPNAAGSSAPGLTVRPYNLSSGTRLRKTFWDGSEPGFLNIDFNFQYLVYSRVFPQYDGARTVSASTITNEKNSFDNTIISDRGEIGGKSRLSKAFGGQEEGGVLQKFDAQWLYTMHPDAWKMMFGTEVNGGGGNMAVSAHMPAHYREDTSGFFRDADENGVAESDEAFGRVLSIDFRTAARTSNDTGLPAAVGTTSKGGWALDIAHHHDRNYLAYLVTGDWYFLEEMLYWTSWNITYNNPGILKNQRHGSWGLCPTSSTREIAGCFRNLAHVIFMMPDLYNAEKQYFLQKLHKNIIVREGAYNIRDGIGFPPNGAGTTCTIDASGTQCPGYNAAAETSPWIFGRMTQGDGKANPFMWVRPCGYVPSTTYVKAAYKGDSPWHEYYVWIIWHHLLDMGFESIDALARATSLNMIQKVMHPDHNKYLVDQYENGNCIVAGDIPISNWLEAKTSISTTYESKNSWTWCGLDQDGYCYRALAVLALAGGSEVSATWSAIEAYNTLKALIPISNLNESPRWAFTPRYEPTRVSTQVGSTFAIIRYVKPRSNEACSYKGVSDGVTTSRFVEIVETGLTPGTQYNASLSCPSDPYGDTSVTFTTAGSALSGTSNYSITVGGNSPTAYIDHGPTNSLGLTASAPCTLGCTITLPAINRGLYYYRIRRSTGEVGETRAIIVQ